MTIPLSTIDKLIQEAQAKHAQRPDYAAFCLSEAHEHLFALKKDLDSEIERRRSDNISQTDIARELNLPRGDLIVGRWAIFNERENTRRALRTHLLKLAEAWQTLFRNDNKAMECLENILYLSDDEDPSKFGFLNTLMYLDYARKIKEIIGEQSAYYRSAMSKANGVISKNINIPIKDLCLLIDSLISVGGKEYLKDGILYLRQAEQLADNVSELINCANVWMSRNDGAYLKDAIRCLRCAERFAADTEDWADCARSRFELAGNKWNGDTQRFNLVGMKWYRQTHGCMLEAQRLASAFSEWLRCSELYYQIHDNDNSEQCLRRAETMARDTLDWIFCAHQWFNLASRNCTEDTQRCILMAEKYARKYDDWNLCRDFYFSSARNYQDAERCLRIMAGLAQTDSEKDGHASLQEEFINERFKTPSC